MEQIGVRELRQHASKYLARVEAGEEIEVTNHGKLVARLVPVSNKERRYRELIESGELIPASRPLDLWKIRRAPFSPDQPTTSELLDHQRNDRL